MGQGSERSRCVVQSHGVATAIAVAAINPQPIARVFDFSGVADAVSQHRTPTSIMERPKMFSTSTRNRSVHGALG